jgi:hypothetical protein
MTWGVLEIEYENGIKDSVDPVDEGDWIIKDNILIVKNEYKFDYNKIKKFYFVSSNIIYKYYKIQELKKSDTRFKYNQIYNQAIDDVLEEIK